MTKVFGISFAIVAVVIIIIMSVVIMTYASYAQRTRDGNLPASVFTGFWAMDKEFQKSAGLMDSYLYMGEPTSSTNTQRPSHILIIKNNGQSIINTKTMTIVDPTTNTWQMMAECDGFPSRMKMTYTPDDGVMLLHNDKTLHAKFIKNNEISSLVKPGVILGGEESMVVDYDSDSSDESGDDGDDESDAV